ncbi:malto-oligosyltrehalose synthase [Agromyces atrinae]|uniref:malto-oligosyltrehalose synthase n=1 Tax=Agromyces atrinae TaxID=592376 RepID=UPI001F5AAFA9|nr:malto-oligosyltrehalose synthase [Agromyces atrinae]MCI2956577.1 malto-oligosyltrehalose synthase [Agromyces atrinae]
MTVPTSTYRLQITADFTLHDAAATVPYLSALGAGAVYLSPILAAHAGSTHGYDVVDPTRIDPDRGGPEGLRALSEAAHAHGLAVVVDIVPNHMGVEDAGENRLWWQMLLHGEGSDAARYFDVEWNAADGRIRLPVLGDDDGQGDLRIEGDELHYFDHRFPIAPGTADDGADARTVHDRQHYELVDWRRADSELNYRRFFAVTTLAALRVEDEHVFAETHVEVARWFDEGLVDALRVDHPDGLRDPVDYLERLRTLTHGAPVWIEKILEPGERLPVTFATAGTTGYDALSALDRVSIDPTGLGTLAEATGSAASADEWHEQTRDSRRVVASGILRSEVNRLARLLPDEPGMTEALIETLASFGVYRSYLPIGAQYLRAALEAAATSRPDLTRALGILGPLLGDAEHPAAIRFQQTSGMVMAKGIEDAAFYRFAAPASLAEVGADPADIGGVDAFHEAQRERLASWPDAMTTLSTHDTKRSEDVRARINALSESPEIWLDAAASLGTELGAGDVTLAALIGQSLIGAWPLSRTRAQDYALKAAREGGVVTSWTDADEAAETRIRAAVDALFDDDSARAALETAVDSVVTAGRITGLVAKALQLASPGVPDVYQGSELWDLSLVDPDNRRPVDFAARIDLLERLDSGWLPDVSDDGAAKLLVVSRLLRLHRDRPEAFTGYEPLHATGSAADHVIAFSRGGVTIVAARLPLGLARQGGWGDTVIALPGAGRADILTDEAVPDGEVLVADLLARYPVAVIA